MRKSYRFLFGVVPTLFYAGCTNTFTAPLSLAVGPVAGTNGEVWLQPVNNPNLVLDTSGTVGPLLGVGSLDRGFGQYDDDLQSSLYLCAVTGPVAGPCLAVLGGLFAIAGASASLAYNLQQGAIGETETTAALAALADDPRLSTLSAQIAGHAAALAQQTGDPIRVATMLPETTCAGTAAAEIPRGVASLDIVDLKVKFEPGYQFKLTMVCRVRTQFCGGDRPTVERRLAYLGGLASMSKDPARASRALSAAVSTAVTALGEYVNAYVHEPLLGTH